MTQYETELSNHLAMAAAETEAEVWHIENAERRNNFLSGKLAALALADTDPFADDEFEVAA